MDGKKTVKYTGSQARRGKKEMKAWKDYYTVLFHGHFGHGIVECLPTLTSIQDLFNPNSWQTPLASVTVYSAPDYGSEKRPKHCNRTVIDIREFTKVNQWSTALSLRGLSWKGLKRVITGVWQSQGSPGDNSKVKGRADRSKEREKGVLWICWKCKNKGVQD